jgi:hypothetical protein
MDFRHLPRRRPERFILGRLGFVELRAHLELDGRGSDYTARLSPEMPLEITTGLETIQIDRGRFRLERAGSNWAFVLDNGRAARTRPRSSRTVVMPIERAVLTIPHSVIVDLLSTSLRGVRPPGIVPRGRAIDVEFKDTQSFRVGPMRLKLVGAPVLRLILPRSAGSVLRACVEVLRGRVILANLAGSLLAADTTAGLPAAGLLELARWLQGPVDQLGAMSSRNVRRVDIDFLSGGAVAVTFSGPLLAPVPVILSPGDVNRLRSRLLGSASAADALLRHYLRSIRSARTVPV